MRPDRGSHGRDRLELSAAPAVQVGERRATMYIGVSLGGIILLLLILWALGVIR